MDIEENTIPPPPLCFSCGNELPESDYDLFHKLMREHVYNGVEENAAEKIILDGVVLEQKGVSFSNEPRKLSKIYQRTCCRLMFQGDAYEYRKYMGMYEKEYPTGI
jgi:DNA-directed RNA polymerase subunit N (RpoN/RPB10)